MQHRRLSVRTASLASQRPIARGFASRSTGLAGRAAAVWRIETSNIRANSIARVLPGPGDRQAPIIRPGAPKRSDSEASSEAAGRRETDAAGGLMVGHGDAGPSSLHAGSASDWAARATAVGAADAARLNPREHCAPQARKGRSISRQAGSVLEVDRGICQAASGRPLLRLVGQAGLD